MYKAIDDFNIAPDTIASIGQFAVLWGMVEEQYFDKYCTNKKLESLNIVKNNSAMVGSALAIREALINYYGSAISATGIMDRLRLRKRDKFDKCILRYLKDETVDANDIICAAVCVCFRIRNNLFHGEKVFWLLNQQKTIIEACSIFLNELLLEKDVLKIEQH